MTYSRFVRRIAAFFIIFSGSLFAQALLDLESNAQDFVLETKQIHVPGFPGAFNASLIRWQGKLLLCFRVRDANRESTFEMGLVWLDEEFNAISEPKILEIRGKNPSTFSQNQDPRLIIIKQRLYIMYSNFITIEEVATRRMFVAELHCEDDSFFINDPLCLHPFEGASKRWEKNWVPFNHNETLLLAHTIMPHHIVQPSLESGECITDSLSYSYIDWAWGELRGGTPALLDGNEYVAFFHSSKIMATAHSKGKKIQHYFMGAYTFSAQPPFGINRISMVPIVGKNFYHGLEYPTWKPLRVVFPMSCISDENYFWVTYGRQDHEIWIAKIDKTGFYQNLIPCPKTSKQFESFYCAYKASMKPDTDEDVYENYRGCS